MKQGLAWVLVVIGLVAIGCGGGGGGGSTSATNATNANAGNNGTVTDLRIGGASGNFFLDPTNIEVGEAVQLRVTGRTSNGQIVTVDSSNWTTTAPASVLTLTQNGLVNGVSASGNVAYTVSAQATGTTVTSAIGVRPAGARLTGRVRNVNNTGVGRVTLKFFTDGGLQVGQALTGHDGTFRASLPTTATRFTIDIEAADPPNGQGQTIYYRQFSYDSADFLNGEPSCFAPLPTLTNGQTTSLATAISLPARISGPPPPPTGCLD